MHSVASFLSEKSGIVPPMDLAFLLLCWSAPGDQAAWRVSGIKTELCRSTLWSFTVVHITVSYQASWGENTPKSVMTAKLGTDMKVEIIQFILRWLHYFSLLWACYGTDVWSIHRSEPSNICIPSHPSSMTIWKSAYFKWKFSKAHSFFSPLVTSKVRK